MRILYATDGSSQARAVGILLAGLHLSPGDEIIILTVAVRGEEAAVADTFKAALEDLSGTSATIGRQVRQGHPDEEILKACQESSADLLTVGAKGASGLARFLLGGVTARVLRHAPCSVLVVRPENTSIRRVVVGFDGSTSALAAATSLTAFPFAAGTDVRLITVLSYRGPHVPQGRPVYMPSGLEERTVILDLAALRKHLRSCGLKAYARILRGDPAAALRDYCEEQQADLVVLGARGSSLPERFHRFLMGSVSEKVASYVPCCALVVRESEKQVL